MTKPFTNQLLMEVLAKVRGSGMFGQVTTSADGEETTQSFSFATGMASLHWQKKYRDQFGGKEPAWLSEIHPGACAEICQIAIDSKRALPKKMPKVMDSKAVTHNTKENISMSYMTTITQTDSFIREVDIREVLAQPNSFHMQFTSRLLSAKNPEQRQMNFDLILDRAGLTALRDLIDSRLKNVDKAEKSS